MYFASTFLSLLDLMIDHLRRLSLSPSDSSDPSSSSPSTDPIRLSSLSYNVILTTDYLHIVPRTAESYVAGGEQSISVNSLGFAGMLLVKDEQSLGVVKKVGVLEVLKSVGYPPVVHGELADEVVDSHVEVDDEPEEA